MPWEIGAVFLTAVFAGFGFAIQQDFGHVKFISLNLVMTVILIIYFLFVRRFHQLAQIHLARCREIESKLGMKQHRLAMEANEKEVEIDGKKFKVPKPRGWTGLKIIPIALIIIFWVSVWRYEIAASFGYQATIP